MQDFQLSKLCIKRWYPKFK